MSIFCIYVCQSVQFSAAGKNNKLYFYLFFVRYSLSFLAEPLSIIFLNLLSVYTQIGITSLFFFLLPSLYLFTMLKLYYEEQLNNILLHRVGVFFLYLSASSTYTHIQAYILNLSRCISFIHIVMQTINIYPDMCI